MCVCVYVDDVCVWWDSCAYMNIHICTYMNIYVYKYLCVCVYVWTMFECGGILVHM